MLLPKGPPVHRKRLLGRAVLESWTDVSLSTDTMEPAAWDWFGAIGLGWVGLAQNAFTPNRRQARL
jgi:hypothetical protein